MNIEQLVTKYSEDTARATKEYGEWRIEQLAWARGAKVNKPNLPYAGFSVNYNWYQEQLALAIKEEFNLTDAQTGYLMGKAYEDYHAYFGDIFWGAHELAEFVTKFPKGT